MLAKLIRKFCFLSLPLLLMSCEEIIMEKDISDQEVELIAPIDNAQFMSTSVTFTWDETTDATEYQLQIARPSFSQPLQIVLDTTITGTTFTQQLPIGEYEWRVRALNSGYTTIFSKRSFVIINNDEFQNNLVQLISPTSNLISNNPSQLLTWQAIIGATGYNIQIINESNTVVADLNSITSSLTYPFPEGSFEWKVRATNGTNYTLFSGRNLLIDTTSPNTPTLNFPANNETIANGNISFEWTRTPIIGSIEKDSIYIYTNSNLTTLLQKNEASSPHDISLTPGTYYWRVKSFDAAGNSSNTSPLYNVIVN